MVNIVTYKSNIDTVIKDVNKVLTKTQYDNAQAILTRAKELTPKDTHALEKSGTITPNGKFEHIVSFNTPYALQVHEDIEAIHKNGQAKYLEQAAQEQYVICFNKLKASLHNVSTRYDI